MSRAFTKESDGTDVFDDLPDRALSTHPNFVTARGLGLIEAEVERHRARLAQAQSAADRAAIAAASRDLRYWSARRASARQVDSPISLTEARFGMIVTIRRDDGRTQRFRIVGEDEADPVRGLLSYVSPLARALIGKKVGDIVPVARAEAEILTIEAGGDASEGAP